MLYYKVELDFERVNDVVCHYSNDYGMGTTMFCCAREEQPPHKDFRFWYDLNEGCTLTDVLANDKGWFVVSSKLRELMIGKVNSEIQFFKVEVVCQNPAVSSGEYYIANILSSVDALCLEESDYSVFRVPSMERPVYSVRKYGIYSNAVKGLDLFKLSGDHVVGIFCSEAMKDLCAQNGITGISFVPIRQRDTDASV